jgi:hypothetical protein
VLEAVVAVAIIAMFAIQTATITGIEANLEGMRDSFVFELGSDTRVALTSSEQSLVTTWEAEDGTAALVRTTRGRTDEGTRVAYETGEQTVARHSRRVQELLKQLPRKRDDR